MTSQHQNQVNNSADAPQPYGGGEMEDRGTTDRYTQGGQQGQEKWNTDEGANVGGEERQHATYNTIPNTNPPDRSQGQDVPTSRRFEDHPLSGEKSEGPFPGATSGATGGGEPTQSSVQQTQTPSSFGNGATGDAQRASTGTETRYKPDSKVESGNGTQFGGGGTGQAGTTAAVGEGGKTTSGTEETTAPGRGPRGMKDIVSGVQGAGEAVRGRVMQGVDEAFRNEAGAEKNREIAEAGMEKMRSGFRGGQGTTASVGGHGGNQGTPAGEKGENLGTAPQTGGTGLRETRY